MSLEIDPHKYSQLIFNKGAKDRIGEKQFFYKCNENNLTSPAKKKKKKPESRPYTLYKNKFKMDNRPKCKIQNYETPRR